MRCRTVTFLFLMFAGLAAWSEAQADRPYVDARPSRPFRKLAPGVMVSIDPEVQLDETVSRHDIVEITAADPKLDWAKDLPFRRVIWHLNFSFKPLRYMWIDEPQPAGKMERKLVRYLLYSVTNPAGKAIRPVEQEDGTAKADLVDQVVRFMPRFLFEIPKYKKIYPDRYIPLAIEPIREREDPSRNYFTAAEGMREIKPGETVWGIATWTDIYPRIDRFSIYVEGLTNAYRWVDEPGRYRPGDPIGTGRMLARKTLKLNFWRPGDEYFEHEDEVHYGAPAEVDYEWLYR